MGIHQMRVVIWLTGVGVLSYVLLAWHFLAQAQDAANTAQAKKDAVDEKAIKKLVAELGDESFDKREAAYKRLAEVGIAALPALEKASKESTDAEVRERAHRLIARLSLNALNGAWSAVSIEIGGKNVTVGKGSPDKIVIERGKMTIFALGKPFAIFQDRELKIDPKATPKTPA